MWHHILIGVSLLFVICEAQTLSSYNIDTDGISVSGISSGGMLHSEFVQQRLTFDLFLQGVCQHSFMSHIQKI